jgi:hypothetical protein
MVASNSAPVAVFKFSFALGGPWVATGPAPAVGVGVAVFEATLLSALPQPTRNKANKPVNSKTPIRVIAIIVLPPQLVDCL